MRGPMVSEVINQLLTTAEWGELYYLVIDMPPETGDIQLTFCQIIPLTAAVIVKSNGDGWKDDCIGTLSSSRSLPASTYLEHTKTSMRHGALGASVGTDLSSVAPLNGKDRAGHLVCYNMFGWFGNKKLFQNTFGQRRNTISSGDGDFNSWRKDSKSWISNLAVLLRFFKLMI
ncbi:hypothetical protein Nepgr_003237 [Nepenthes gracilis]|uniref:Uncharacterized protein n=1 Tax=Nepenthes gracilis TaxID=150966 RepID=A0AAD3RZ61_NEPGR|nr:hypothetical protein Nepgr_003237 [Nepenthes gracilis]